MRKFHYLSCFSFSILSFQVQYGCAHIYFINFFQFSFRFRIVINSVFSKLQFCFSYFYSLSSSFRVPRLQFQFQFQFSYQFSFSLLQFYFSSVFQLEFRFESIQTLVSGSVQLLVHFLINSSFVLVKFFSSSSVSRFQVQFKSVLVQVQSCRIQLYDFKFS